MSDTLDKEVRSEVEGYESPDAVEHVTVREYPDVEIGSQNIVKISDLLISKESVWHPDF